MSNVPAGRKPKKLYCYVDETGQDTGGKLFIVSIVIADTDRDQIVKQLELIEQSSAKGKVKWIKAKPDANFRYLKLILETKMFGGKLFYSKYRQTTDYVPMTILTAAKAVLAYADAKYKVIVLIDGLPKSRQRWFGSQLRRLHISTEKVRGVKKEENNALMRLADAVAGFVRQAETNIKFHRLLKSALAAKVIKEI
jgi:hypothetical protein